MVKLRIYKLSTNYNLITANTNKTMETNIQRDPRRVQHIITNLCDILSLAQACPIMHCVYTCRHAWKHLEGYHSEGLTLGRILATSRVSHLLL